MGRVAPPRLPPGETPGALSSRSPASHAQSAWRNNCYGQPLIVDIARDLGMPKSLSGLSPDIRMRLNAVYSAGTFIGGSVLSLLTPVIWTHFGWSAVAITGLMISVLPIVISSGKQR